MSIRPSVLQFYIFNFANYILPSLNLKTDSSNSILKIQEILMHLGGGKCWRGLFKRCKWEGYSLVLPLNSLSKKMDRLPHHPKGKKLKLHFGIEQSMIPLNMSKHRKTDSNISTSQHLHYLQSQRRRPNTHTQLKFVGSALALRVCVPALC